MPDDLSAESLERRTFSQARRGYERDEVDRFVADVARRIRTLESQAADVSRSMEQLGISDLGDAKREIDSIATELGEILEEARKAAAQMRARASADAAQWRAEADSEVRTQRESARRDSEKARKDAWETSTEMLEQAQAERSELVGEAEKDALFIRAEAEREALRLTGDARRDAEEMARDSRTEADRVLMAARAEAENILAEARQSAETAQERARALEQRRAELMSELEAARVSIGQLESEIDLRRESLHQVATSSETSMRIIEPAREAEAWVDEDATVKIVPATRIPVEEPVDADALVAEVEQLRARAAGILTEEEIAAEPPEELEAPEEQLEPEAAEDLPAEPVVEMEETEAVAEPVPAEPPPETPQPELPDASAAPEPEPEAEKDHVIDDLFASLREAPSDAEVVEHPSRADAMAPVEPPAAVSEPPPKATPAATVTEAAVAATETDPFDVRDRSLLPITNRSLRSLKREIVELQNRVLEELRTAGTEWEPDRAMFSAALADEVMRLVQESFVAGHVAAAELVGSSKTPQPAGPPPGGLAADIVGGLTEAVSGALADAARSGSGARQQAAAVSKVFRAWRTDEAERRLRFASRAAYHGGLAGGFVQLGVHRVMAVAMGRPCGQCAASSGVSWEPGEPPAGNETVPPASPACDDTLVPAVVGS